jgi:cytochrome c peroxidase
MLRHVARCLARAGPAPGPSTGFQRPAQALIDQRHNSARTKETVLLRIGIPTKIAIASVMILTASLPGTAQARRANRALGPLTGLQPPAPPALDYNQVVNNQASLVALGKALFWDSSIGADGQACASCHFHAGADPRIVNQLNPGLNQQPAQDDSFGDVNHRMGDGTAAGPDITLSPGDFPFHKLANVNNRDSGVTYDSNDIVGSEGVFEGGPLTLLQQIKLIGNQDKCSTATSTVFFIGGANGVPINTRKVEPRNTPTNINAVFNYRNFWDGRANNGFNGFNPFGRRAYADPTAKVWYTDGTNVHSELLDLPNMSAASQAVGPATSSFEMACLGRTFADIGRRVLVRGALLGQAVAPDDSVFSRTAGISLVANGAGGLTSQYRDLVHRAFKPTWWQDSRFFVVDPATGAISVRPLNTVQGYQLDELNFGMFFGFAIDAYERTLISDQTPLDTKTLSADAQAGQALFKNKAGCINCHDGPLLSKAATFVGDSLFETVEHMPMSDTRPAFYDNGFYNIGVRPAFEDVGVGNTDPYGNPLSLTRQFVQSPGTSNVGVDQFPVNPCGFEVAFSNIDCSLLPAASAAASVRIAVDGLFKAPGLRNVALTPPYFHNGGQKSLADVVAFYNRGGDRRVVGTGDTTGTGVNGRPLGTPAPVTPGMGGSNADPNVQPLGLTAQEQGQLVAFLQSLTDRRVACHSAPFDHPGLTLANGQLPQDRSPADGNADDIILNLPAVGAGGFASCAGLFDQLNAGDLFVSSPAFMTLIK